MGKNHTDIHGLTEKKYPVSFFVILAIFIIIFSLISLVNHYQFRTFALDLGMFNQAVYHFAHLKIDYFTLGIDGIEKNFFATHFSPIMLIYSPLYYLFGSYTLLVVQIAAIIFGGFGIYKYAIFKLDSQKIALVLLIQFFGIWGIYSALAFDFHNNVVAAMFIPWFIYFLEIKNKKFVVAIFVLVLISKENMSLWMSFILLGFIFKDGIPRDKKILKFEIPLFFVALVYFIAVVHYVMPWLGNEATNSQLGRYSLLGTSITGIVSTIIKEPSYIFSLLFEVPLGDKLYFGIKSELHLMILVSGGIALIYRPYYIIMLIPIYAQKLLSNDYATWGINYHYSIEFVPILTLAVIDMIRNIKGTKKKYYLALSFALITLFFNFNAMDHRKSLWYNSRNTRFYEPTHYKTNLNISAINEALKLIPKNTKVSVCSSLAPHLAFSKKLYHFPITKDADYITLFSEARFPYPLSKEEYEEKVKTLKESNKFKVIYNDNNLLILKKK